MRNSGYTGGTLEFNSSQVLFLNLFDFFTLRIDGTIVDIANVNRARTQKIRRVKGKVWWTKKRRKIIQRDNGQVVDTAFTGVLFELL